ILRTDGTASATFSGAIFGHTYWIAVRHRNTVQTWSAAPIAFTQTTTYDFTTASARAYLDNMILVDVSPDIWAFYNGDINQDSNIDLVDFPALDFGINHGLFGYLDTDLN